MFCILKIIPIENNRNLCEFLDCASKNGLTLSLYGGLLALSSAHFIFSILLIASIKLRRPKLALQWIASTFILLLSGVIGTIYLIVQDVYIGAVFIFVPTGDTHFFYCLNMIESNLL